MEITATKVSDDKRLKFLPRLFGSQFLRGERAAYNWAESLSDDHDGAYWEFFDLSNGSGFMAPAGDKEYKVEVSTNYYSGTMSTEAFGIVVTLFAMSSLFSETMVSEELIDKYELLRDFAAEHPEASKIYKAID